MNMKRITLGLVVAGLLFLSSCATTVQVRHLIPSEVNLSGYRTIAVASTDSYRFPFGRPVSPWIRGLNETSFSLTSGYANDLSNQVADLGSRYLTQTLMDTDYFTILGPDLTDAYLTLSSSGEDSLSLLKAKGVQAILRSSITYMGCDESIYGRDKKTWVSESLDPLKPTVLTSYEKVTGRDYYLLQKATVTFTYTLMDIETGKIVTTKSFTDQRDRETLIGRRTYEDQEGSSSRFSDERIYASGFAPSFVSLFDRMLDGFQNEISHQLAPSWQTFSVSLMSNKPKVDAVKQAYELSKAGSLQKAYSLFLGQWSQSGHVPSGYNAALLLEAQGDLKEAVDLMNEVYNFSGNSKARSQFLRMQKALSDQIKAEKQFSGDVSSGDEFMVMTQFYTVE